MTYQAQACSLSVFQIFIKQYWLMIVRRIKSVYMRISLPYQFINGEAARSVDANSPPPRLLASFPKK